MAASAHHLSTQRLSLTALTPQDQAFVTALLGDQAVRQFLGGVVPPSERIARFQAYLTGASGVDIWAVHTKVHAQPIGLIILSPHHNGVDTEISYQFSPSFWCNGYASEAVRCVLEHVRRTLALPRVVAETQAANTASCRLLRRLGLEEVGKLERFGQPQILFATSRERSDSPTPDH